MPRTFYERELVISSRAHLPTWLPRTQRSRLVPAAMLESQMSVGTQRGGHTIVLRVPPGTLLMYPPGRDLSHLEDVDGEAFQVSLSVSSSEPPTHFFLHSKSLIGGPVISARNIRCISTDTHYSTTRLLRGVGPYHSLSFFREHVNTHTLHATAGRNRRKQRDSFRRTSDRAPISPGEPRKEQRARRRAPLFQGRYPRSSSAIPNREDDNRSKMTLRARRSFLRENAKKRAGNCVSDAAR